MPGLEETNQDAIEQATREILSSGATSDDDSQLPPVSPNGGGPKPVIRTSRSSGKLDAATAVFLDPTVPAVRRLNSCPNVTLSSKTSMQSADSSQGRNTEFWEIPTRSDSLGLANGSASSGAVNGEALGTLASVSITIAAGDQRRIGNKCLNIQSELRKRASNDGVSLQMGNKFLNMPSDIRKQTIDADTALQQTGNRCLGIQSELRKQMTDADTLQTGTECLNIQSGLGKGTIVADTSLQTGNECPNIQSDRRKQTTDADTLHTGNKCLRTLSDLRKRTMNGVSSDEFGIGRNSESCPTGYSRQSAAEQVSQGCAAPKPLKPSHLQTWNRCYGFQQANCYCASLISMMAVCSFLLLYAHGMQSQVLFLQEELQRLHENAELCPEVDLQLRTERTDIGGNNLFDLATKLTERHIRSFALLLSLLLLASPILCIKYIDDIYRISRSSKSSSYVQNQDSENIDEEVPFSKRLAYRLDVLFSNHSFIKPLALFMATVLLIAVGGMALFGVSGENLADALWRAWTYIADSGNHADSTGIGPRLVSVFISFGGMLIFALMLGLVSDAISEKVDSLRKGKSEVIEHDHTLILGWSDKLGSLLKQLSIANQSIGGGVVVVLSERDKEEMEMDIAKLEFDFKGTSVICRSGSPLILADLKKVDLSLQKVLQSNCDHLTRLSVRIFSLCVGGSQVSVSKARSIIVLAEVENADQSDARALRVVLSLTGVKEGLRGHVVVEISDLDNEPLVKLVGGGIVETVVAHDVIGRLMIQCARQPGLAQIWEDILGFENAEFYLKRWPQLDGKSFGELLISFPDAIPCGVKVAAKDGKIVLNPSDDYIMCEGDELLVVAEDDDSYAPTQPAEVQRGVLPEYRHYPKIPEKILFCGWRRDIDDMIVVLDAFLAPGSELWMFSEVPITEREKKLLDGDLQFYKLKHLTLVHKEGNAVIRRHLEMLPLETFDSILILADEALEDSVVKADSRSLATLLLIRDIQSKRMPDREQRAIQVRQSGSTQSTWIREMQQASYQSIIISEILDSRTKNLVSVSKIGDYVLSNELVSMALAMVAEDKQINRVLEELFAEEGNEMYIRPAELYLFDQEELCFYEVMVRARQRNEVVIGYRLATMDHAIINPPNKNVRIAWTIFDIFIVLSEEE